MKYKIFIIILLFFLFVNSTIAQEISNYDRISFPSPNAASLGIFGKIPVGIFTGTPDISVPLYEVKQGITSVPIELRYHASGIRPEEQPSWIGLGWTLQAGGAISRNIKGLPDEAIKDYKKGVRMPSDLDGAGFYYSRSKLSGDDWMVYTNDDITYGYDKEPDEFSFNFNGISGSFYLDHNGNWIVKSESPIKVEFNSSSGFKLFKSPLGGYKCFFKFTLIDQDGTKYIFGDSWASIEFTRPQYGSDPLVPAATTWNLTKIIDPNGNEITFNYIRGNLIPQLGYSEGQSSISTDYKLFLGSLDCSSSSYQWNYSCILIEPSYLESITTRNEVIMFYSSAANDLMVPVPVGITWRMFCNDKSGGYSDIYLKGATNYNNHPYEYKDDPIQYPVYYGVADDIYRKRKKLNKICIFPNNTGITIPTNDVPDNPTPDGDDFSSAFKIINFDYTEVSTKRLTLNYIYTSASDFVPVEKYSFDYFDDPVIELPDYGTFEIDHWGYYNGTKAQLQNGDFAGYYALREPNTNISYQLEGMLKTIKYPTGGYTVFEYESHNYSSFFKRIPIIDSINNIPVGVGYIDIGEENSNIKLPGLRIREIRSYSNNNPDPITHKYLYIKDYTSGGLKSSGYLNNKPYYYWADNVATASDLVCNQIWPTPIIICQTVGGISHFFHFSSNSLLPLSMNGSHIGYSEVVELEPGNGYTIYKYSMPQNTDPNNPQHEQYQDYPPINFIGNSYFKPIIDVSLERGKLLSKEMYDVNNSKTKSLLYAYNSDPSRLNQYVRSKNTDVLVECIHAISYWFGSAIVILTYPFNIEEEKVIDYNNGVATNQLTTTFKYTANKQIREKKKLQSDGNYLVTVYTYPYDYTDQSGFIYDMNNNHVYLPIETVTYKTNASGDQVTILSGEIEKYKGGGKGNIDEVLLFESANAQPVPLSGFKFSNKSNAGKLPTDDNTNTTFSENNNSYGKYVSRFKYGSYDNYGNINETTNEKGITKAYVWSYKQSYPICQVVNTNYNTVETALGGNTTVTTFSQKSSPTTTEVQTFLAPLYSDATLKNSFISTYSYNPLIGLTASSDPNRVTTIFDYDNLGRLETIKDDDSRIQKNYEYKFSVQNWEPTGNTQCKLCDGNSAHLSNITLIEEKDMNPNSSTYNQTRWVDGCYTPSCAATPDWQNTANTRCFHLFVQQEQVDTNPCSLTYNQTKWINVELCKGPNKACINGVCEYAVSCELVSCLPTDKPGWFWVTCKCVFSDGSSNTYTERSQTCTCTYVTPQ